MVSTIPRLYTALAEWGACMVYILILQRRVKGMRFLALSACALLATCAIQVAAEFLPVHLWMLGMLCAVAVMFAFLCAATHLSLRDVGFCTVRAFILAEFAASLEWQLYTFFFGAETSGETLRETLFVIVVFSLVFAAMFFLERRHMPAFGKLHVHTREVASSVIICAAVFLMSNISFVYANTPFSGTMAQEMYYIRTLVDLSGLAILYAQQEQRREMQLRHELETIEAVFNRQFELYQISRDTIERINRTYHDLKHQIIAIRAETDLEKQAQYLGEMEEDIRTYQAQNQTGSHVLDTLLFSKQLICAEQGIALTCVADGALLDFMHIMDVCTLFGNALDNAMESLQEIADMDKRLIKIAIYRQNDFVMMRFENYLERPLELEDGLPSTTKQDRHNHGFGLKSIRQTAEKYNGTMTVSAEDEWFALRILIPIP